MPSRLSPEDPTIYYALAWVLATCPKKEVRDGKRAIKLAKRACELSNWKEANSLHTLAVAHAELGQFKEAVKWQKKAIDLGIKDAAKLAEARERLKLYEQGKPYGEE